MIKTNIFKIILFSFLGLQLFGILPPLLPTLQRDFDLNTFEVTLTLFITIAARLVVSIPIGYLYKRRKLKGFLLFAVTIAALGFLLSSQMKSYGHFLLTLFISGIGSASLISTILLYVSETRDRTERGRLLGVNQSSMMLAFAVGPLYAGAITQYYGWRAVFLIMGIFLSLLTLLLLGVKFKETDQKESVQQEAEAQNDLKTGDYQVNWLTVIVIHFVSFALMFAMGGFGRAIIPLIGGNIFQLPTTLLGVSLSLIEFIRLLVVIGGSYIALKYSHQHVIAPGLTLGGISMVLLSSGRGTGLYFFSIILFAIGRIGGNFPVGLLIDHIPKNRINMMTSVNRFIADAGLLLGPTMLGWVMDHYGVRQVGIISALIVWVAVAGLLLYVKKEPASRRAI